MEPPKVSFPREPEPGVFRRANALRPRLREDDTVT